MGFVFICFVFPDMQTWSFPVVPRLLVDALISTSVHKMTEPLSNDLVIILRSLRLPVVRIYLPDKWERCYLTISTFATSIHSQIHVNVSKSFNHFTPFSYSSVIIYISLFLFAHRKYLTRRCNKHWFYCRSISYFIVHFVTLLLWCSSGAMLADQTFKSEKQSSCKTITGIIGQRRDFSVSCS